METYLVTGGAGFIGSHTVRHLAEMGHCIRVLDNFSTGNRENLSGAFGDVEIVEADVRDYQAVRSAALGADYIIHLAAQISVPASIDDPATTEEINTGGTMNALLAAREAGVKRFVLASSCAVCGDTESLPVKEDYPPSPLSPYAVAKLAAEYYCRIFEKLYNLPTVVLRYFNVFGPGQRPDSPYAAVIPKFVDAVATGTSPTVHGDGEQTRDFVYVENVARVNVTACKAEDAVGQVINIGSGIETSLNQLLATLRAIAGRDVAAVNTPPRSGDIRRSVADISLARTLLGFDCRIGLEEGLRRTFQYFTPP